MSQLAKPKNYQSQASAFSYHNNQSYATQATNSPSQYSMILPPPKILTSQGHSTQIINYNASRKDVVDRIVDQAITARQPPPQARLQSEYYSSFTQGKDFSKIINTENFQAGYNPPAAIHDVTHNYNVHEIHHINRPVTVASLDNVTRPWEIKLLVLERQKIELEEMIKRGLTGNKHDVRQIKVEDRHKLKRLEQDISDLEDYLKQREKSIEELKAQLKNLEQELQEAGSSSEITYYETELNTWKKRFVDLNREFHDAQEQLMLAQAESESLKNRQVKTVTSVVQQLTGKTR